MSQKISRPYFLEKTGARMRVGPYRSLHVGPYK